MHNLSEEEEEIYIMWKRKNTGVKNYSNIWMIWAAAAAAKSSKSFLLLSLSLLDENSRS
jgi:hypothetical protein